MTVLLQGIVGSTAYGLAREGSDVDRLGVFVAPTVEVAGIGWCNTDKDTRVTTNPDKTLHEIGKYLTLALKCNPTITELLWLPSRYIEIMEPFFGGRLIAMRRAFLHTGAVKAAYGGYARQQAYKLCQRGDGTFSADTRNRTVKHARHMLRLIRQGRQILETGKLTVQVNNPEEYFAFDTMSTEDMLATYAVEDELFKAAKSVLPDKPDRQTVSVFLDGVRANYLWGDEK